MIKASIMCFWLFVSEKGLVTKHIFLFHDYIHKNIVLRPRLRHHSFEYKTGSAGVSVQVLSRVKNKSRNVLRCVHYSLCPRKDLVTKLLASLEVVSWPRIQVLTQVTKVTCFYCSQNNKYPHWLQNGYLLFCARERTWTFMGCPACS